MALITITMNDNIEATAAYSEATLQKTKEVQARQLAQLKEAEKTKKAWAEIFRVGKPLRMGNPSPEKKKALEEKVRALKAKHGIKGGSYQTAIEKVVRLGIETRTRAALIKREEKNQKAKPAAKTTKTAPKSVMKQPVTKKPTAKTAPAVKTVKARGSKITVDINKTAGNKVVKDNAKISKLSNEKAKPAAALHKKDNVKSPAITNVLSKIKAIKEDIAKTKAVSKRQHLEKELAALRSQLRVLRKGQSAKNQAAMQHAPNKSGMGGAKKITTRQKGMGDAKATPLDIKEQRAKVSDLRIKVAKEKDPTKKAALEKRYKSAVSKMKKMKLVK